MHGHQTGQSSLSTSAVKLSKLKSFSQDIGATQQIYIFDCVNSELIQSSFTIDARKNKKSKKKKKEKFGMHLASQPYVGSILPQTTDLSQPNRNLFTTSLCKALAGLKSKYKSPGYAIPSEIVKDASEGQISEHIITFKMLLEHYNIECKGQFLFFQNSASNNIARIPEYKRTRKLSEDSYVYSDADLMEI